MSRDLGCLTVGEGAGPQSDIFVCALLHDVGRHEVLRGSGPATRPGSGVAVESVDGRRPWRIYSDLGAWECDFFFFFI